MHSALFDPQLINILQNVFFSINWCVYIFVFVSNNWVAFIIPNLHSRAIKDFRWINRKINRKFSSSFNSHIFWFDGAFLQLLWTLYEILNCSFANVPTQRRKALPRPLPEPCLHRSPSCLWIYALFAFTRCPHFLLFSNVKRCTDWGR